MDYILVLILAVGDPIRLPATLTECMHAHRGWRYADATGRRHMAYDTITRQKAHVVEVQCVEEKRQGVPTS